jgi:hypothetical protein
VRSLALEAMIGVGPSEMSNFLEGESLEKIYYFKYGTICMKCWCKVKVCTLSNNY